MARYRKVDCKLWSDARFRRLSAAQPNAQTLWIYLLTGPQTTCIPGLFSIGEAGLAERLTWPLEGLRQAFREGLVENLYEADLSACLIWIPRALEYDPPASPNVIKTWTVVWDELPECELKIKAFQSIKAYLKAFSEAFLKAFLESCSDPSLEASPRPSPNPDSRLQTPVPDKTPPPAPRERGVKGASKKEHGVAVRVFDRWQETFLQETDRKPGQIDLAAEKVLVARQREGFSQAELLRVIQGACQEIDERRGDKTFNRAANIAIRQLFRDADQVRLFLRRAPVLKEVRA